MKHAAYAAGILLWMCWPALADDKPKDDKSNPAKSSADAKPPAADDKKTENAPKTPKEQIQRIIDEFQKERMAYSQSLRKAKTDDERKALQAKAPNPAKSIEMIESIVKEHPKSDVSFFGLNWIIQNALDPKTSERIVKQMLAEHIESKELAPIVTTIAFRLPEESARKTLAMIANKTPHREVKAGVALALVQLDQRKSADSKLLESAKTVADLIKLEEDAKKNSIERWENVKKEFGDVKLGSQQVGVIADRMITSLTRKSDAEPGPKQGDTVPEVVGKDADEKEFKLSEYRGKVVLLDFWGFW